MTLTCALVEISHGTPVKVFIPEVVCNTIPTSLVWWAFFYFNYAGMFLQPVMAG